MDSGGRDVGFVGREAEVATIGRAVDDARRGSPSVVLVGGDAGIGKSTLVHEAANRAKAAMFLGRAVHVGGEALPLSPLFDLVRQVARSPQAGILDRPDLAVLNDAARRLPRSGSGDAVPAEGIFVPVLDLFGALGEDDGVVVGFEDLHWADVVTWDLFEFLARNLVDEPVVLTGTYRADEVGRHPSQRRRLAELTRLPAAHRIHLAGLGRDDVAARITAALGAPPPADLLDEVLARGGGNPFFTDELVAAHLSGEALPAVLSDLLAADLGDLSPAARRVVGAAAVVGRDVSQELLAAVVDDDTATEAGLREALDAQMLVVQRDTGAYRFRHPLIGEVVYDALLPSERQRLHRRTADAISSADTSTADAIAALAFHLDRAGDRQAALAASLAAADAAEPLSTAAAATHLDRALAMWDDTRPVEERIRRMWQAADLHNATRNNERAIELGRAALALGDPPKGAAWGYERLGRFLWTEGRLEESATAYDQAAALLAERPDGTHAASVFAGMAQAELMLCRFASAERWAEKALAAGDRDDVFAAPATLRVLGLIRSHQRDREGGVTLCRDAVAAAESVGAPAHVRLLAVIYLVMALMDAGHYDEATATALDGEAEAQRAGLGSSHAAYLAGEAAECLVRRGQWAEADTVLRSYALADLMPVAVVRLGIAAGLVAARRGDGETADRALERARAAAGDPFHGGLTDAAAAEISLALGRWPEAAARAEEAVRIAASNGTPVSDAHLAMLGTFATAENLLDAAARREPTDRDATIGRLEDLVGSARASAAAAAGVTLDERAALAHAEAAIAQLHGPAADRWAEAASAWREAGDPWLAAVAATKQAEAAVAAGAAAPAVDALRTAYDTSVSLGAARLVEEIEAIAKRTRIALEAPAVAPVEADAVVRFALTPREAEVLSLVAAGLTNREIGERLYVSEKTASVHISNILRKLGVTSRVEAAAIAQRAGID